jgi:hypothetical protein
MGAACYEISDNDQRLQCVKTWDAATERDVGQETVANYYKTEWRFILVATVVLSALIYGLSRGIGFVSMWVYKGFKQPA